MTFLEAAENVLRVTGRSMKPDEIVKAAIAKGLLSPSGKTPEDTMDARLSEHVKDGGKVFVRTSPGFYALAEMKPWSVQPDLFDVENAPEPKKDPEPRKDTKKPGRKAVPVGCVYILSNPSFKNDWLKIGQTSDPEPWARMKELFSTPVPLPFSCVAYMQTRRFVQAEKHIHSFIDRFTNKRISEKREFFRMDQQNAIETLRDVAMIVHGVVHVGPFDMNGVRETGTTPPVKDLKCEWLISRNGVVVAKGHYCEDRIEVLVGARINMAKSSKITAVEELRKRLLKDGQIVEKKLGQFTLKAKQTFSSPSAASCFVLGGSTNGWEVWKNANGEPLDVMRKK